VRPVMAVRSVVAVRPVMAVRSVVAVRSVKVVIAPEAVMVGSIRLRDVGGDGGGGDVVGSVGKMVFYDRSKDDPSS
jgi:hypothetical protein